MFEKPAGLDHLLGRSKIRRRILALFVADSHQRWHLREIARRAETSAGTASRELARLIDGGLVRRTKEGNQVYYEVVPSTVFRAVSEIVRQTSAARTVLRTALEDLPGVESAAAERRARGDALTESIDSGRTIGVLPWTSVSTNRLQIELGLNLPYVEKAMDGRTPRWTDVLAMARAAESIGFDAIWVSDHVGFGDPEGAWQGAWESWTLLSALAVSTHRVALGNYVLAVSFRNPALLGKMAETLDEISGGRVILGLGAGWNEPEYTSFGVPFDDRFRRFEDALRIITDMLRHGSSTHDGHTIQTRSARIQPRGPRPEGLPVLVGANGPRMLRLTAELADHWNGGMAGLDELPEMLEEMDGICRAVGRDPTTLIRSAEVLVRTVAASAGVPAEEKEIRGEPAAIAAKLRAYADLGLDHLQVQVRPNSIDGVAAFAPVMEQLRGVRPQTQ